MINLISLHIKKRIHNIILFIILSLLSMILSLIIPYFNGIFFDVLIQKGSVKYISQFVLVIASFTIISIILDYVYGIFSSKLKTEIVFSFYKDILKHIQKMPINVLKEYNMIYLNQRINADVSSIVSFFMEYYINILVQAIYILVLGIILFNINQLLFGIIILLVPIYIMIYLKSIKPLINSGIINKEEAAQFYKKGNEQLELYNEIKANSLYDESDLALKRAFPKYFQSVISYVKIRKKYRVYDLFLTSVANCLTLVIGSHLVINGKMSIGLLITAITYYSSIFSAIKVFFGIGQQYQDTKGAYLRLKNLIDIEEEKSGSILPMGLDDIHIKDLKYKYMNCNNKKVFDKISCVIKTGGIYLISGDNGTGKTTFINILLGLLQDFEGTICYDKNLICNINMEKVRKKYISTYVQNLRMPDESVLEVITEWTNKNSAEIEAFILQNNLEGIYREKSFDIGKIYEKNINQLSIGEKQKIALLITIIRNRRVLILDEPTSNLDAECVKKFSEYLKQICHNKIILLVSHDKKLISNIGKYEEINLDNP